jgi:hypothetical protein
MAQLAADGVEVDLPHGWEGHIRRLEEDPTAEVERANAAYEALESGGVGTF